MPNNERVPLRREQRGSDRKPGMLVLSRRVGQWIVIDVPDSNGSSQRIEIVFIGYFDTQQARIGIRAGKEVRILRNELLQD